ncbi:hypothetical protein FZC76_14690 [Sutcliffiella horikoshii]|uniref:Uncharacterized protein n=1 Tax=Sutcliffiella horikoshii TaxID=79883 RepID=A0A5D4SWX3_9BACI|nr:hypothetical protein [Sutcliffiella horikoshii]TYS67805.1 hypothetical protein FZC76_14690 [Sutcliffiella horikoshii]
MDVMMLGFTIAFFFIGVVVLSFLKSNLPGMKENAQVWFVIGTTVWGIVTIFLVIWWFNVRF